MMGGEANPSGVALMCIMATMFICSLPFVRYKLGIIYSTLILRTITIIPLYRRRGHFETFYYTHMLYWGYFILLLFHAPEFWKWICIIGLIWLVEIAYRILNYLFGHGKSVINTGVLLPSRVTQLVIERPQGFNFSPGDSSVVKRNYLLVLLFSPAWPKGTEPKTGLRTQLVDLVNINLVLDLFSHLGKLPIGVPGNSPKKFRLTI